MTTITMPRSFDAALQEVAKQSMVSAVETLAEKYGFDLAEAVRFLELGDIKVVKKRGPVPKSKKSIGDSDEEKPKRRVTGYLKFSGDQRPVVRSELKDELGEDEKLAPQAVVKALGARWKALSQAERDEWNQRALDASDDPKPKKEPKEPKAKEPKAKSAKPAKEPKAKKEPIRIPVGSGTLLSDSDMSDDDSD